MLDMKFKVKSAQVKKGYLRLVIKREGPKALCIFVGVINLADSRLNCFIQGERIASDLRRKKCLINLFMKVLPRYFHHRLFLLCDSELIHV